jgi:deazaflavin-dependent oxidoreductase (nitroreductase family)
VPTNGVEASGIHSSIGVIYVVEVRGGFRRGLQKRVINPITLRRAGAPGARYARLETVGRRSGQARVIPVGYGLAEGCVWLVAEHGRSAAYVRNLVAEPRVRIMFDGAWHAGRASVVDSDDPVARLQVIDPATAREIRGMGTSLLSIRIDLAG